MGRPKATIDWNDVGEMLKAGCDATAIATTLGISTDTLYVRSKKDNKLDFSAYSQQKRAAGNDLLRRKQFEVAMSGNVSMLIWLGKNRLGQSDKQEIKAVEARPNEDETANKFLSVVRHARRIVEHLVLTPKGIEFDKENPEHRQALKTQIRNTIKAETDLYPEELKYYKDWEERFEKLETADLAWG